MTFPSYGVIALVLLLSKKISLADNLPECYPNNSINVQCDDSPTNYFFFSNEFYGKFNLIHIGRDNLSDNFEIVGCSCETFECELWCCTADTAVISFNKCSLNSYSVEKLNILGESVDIFEYTFHWFGHSKMWTVCNDSHPLLEEDNDEPYEPVVITERSFFTQTVFFPERVIVGECSPILDLQRFNMKYSRHRGFSDSNDLGDRISHEYIFWTHALSIPFDIITIIVYVSLPNLRTVHGMSLVSLQFCFILANILTMYAYSTDYTETNICYVISLLSYWVGMSKELWMFTIGFDLWKCFCVGPPNAMITTVIYSLFAWGTPLSVVATLLVTNPEPVGIEYVERNYNCWQINCCFVNLFVLEDITLYPYIESACVMFNVVFLLLTTMKIYITDRSGRATQRMIDYFFTFFHLFTIMQAMWIFSKIVQYISGVKGLWTFCYKFAYRIDVTLRGASGIIIFFLFILKKSIRKEFWNTVTGIYFTRIARRKTLQRNGTAQTDRQIKADSLD